MLCREARSVGETLSNRHNDYNGEGDFCAVKMTVTDVSTNVPKGQSSGFAMGSRYMIGDDKWVNLA
jgi:hypothetical protein